MRKSMKASTLHDNQIHDDVTVSTVTAIVLQNLTTPSNADEDGIVDSLSSQLFPPRRSTWEQLLTWANDRLRKTENPSQTNTQWRRLIVAFRSPQAKKAISEERQPPTIALPEEVAERTTLKRQMTS